MGGPFALSDLLRTSQQIERMVALRKLRIATIVIPKLMEFIADLRNMMNQSPRFVKSEGSESGLREARLMMVTRHGAPSPSLRRRAAASRVARSE